MSPFDIASAPNDDINSWYRPSSKESEAIWADAKDKSVVLRQIGTEATNAKEQRVKDHAGVFVNTSILRQTAEPESKKEGGN